MLGCQSVGVRNEPSREGRRAGRPGEAQPRGAAGRWAVMDGSPCRPVVPAHFRNFAEPWLCRFVTLLFAPLMVARFG